MLRIVPSNALKYMNLFEAQLPYAAPSYFKVSDIRISVLHRFAAPGFVGVAADQPGDFQS